MVSQLEQPTIQVVPNDDFYGMKVFRMNGRHYAADTIAKAEIAAREIVREAPDKIDTQLILKHTSLPPTAAPIVEYLKDSYGLMKEAELLLAVMPDVDAFVEEAIARYGRGHFLKLYEQNEEQSLNDFPHEIAGYILAELGWPDWDQVCVYKLG